VELPDFVRSGNQAVDPSLYEVENAAIDPDGVLWEGMRALADWAGRDLLDLGCGSGWWLPRYATGPAAAARVVGVEPDQDLVALAQARAVAGRVEVLQGSAERIPLPDASVDVVHARFAYFFPPGCDAGLAECLRVLRPGGALVVVDNDQRHGEFAGLLAAAGSTAQGTADVTDAWWAERGAERHEVVSSWRFGSRADLAAVLRLELPGEVAADWLRARPDAVGLSYGYVLFAVRAPTRTGTPSPPSRG
jgi:SAM-dependent methyltransferase